MNQDLPPPPQELRPWYYQNLFLMVAFVLWLAWAVLIIRSPWHNGILSGGVAWAYLICGSVFVFKTVQAGAWYPVLNYLVPGLVLTVALQVFWAAYKKQYLGPYLPEYNSAASGTPEDEGSAPSQSGAMPDSTPRARLRRRSRSRRPPRH